MGIIYYKKKTIFVDKHSTYSKTAVTCKDFLGEESLLEAEAARTKGVNLF